MLENEFLKTWGQLRAPGQKPCPQRGQPKEKTAIGKGGEIGDVEWESEENRTRPENKKGRVGKRARQRIVPASKRTELKTLI